jgi:hypothetical protein
VTVKVEVNVSRGIIIILNPGDVVDFFNGNRKSNLEPSGVSAKLPVLKLSDTFYGITVLRNDFISS